ncbi:hypothetical protein [Streptomyces echinatus]|uniref:hypothetical protein n=1 Tax=Streptomyces echinatus TaxID=67293 RepID=UPI003797B4ED
MTRLFEGRRQRTDGRLTKENLYKEAQVSRATMNRAHAILAEWDAHLAVHGKTTPGEAKRDAAIADLKKRLTKKTQECTLLEKKLKAAHTAIAALFHETKPSGSSSTRTPRPWSHPSAHGVDGVGGASATPGVKTMARRRDKSQGAR